MISSAQLSIATWILERKHISLWANWTDLFLKNITTDLQVTHYGNLLDKKKLLKVQAQWGLVFVDRICLICRGKSNIISKPTALIFTTSEKIELSVGYRRITNLCAMYLYDWHLSYLLRKRSSESQNHSHLTTGLIISTTVTCLPIGSSAVTLNDSQSHHKLRWPWPQREKSKGDVQ